MFEVLQILFGILVVSIGTLVIAVFDVIMIMFIYMYIRECLQRLKSKGTLDINDFSNRLEKACRECNDTCKKIDKEMERLH